MNNIFIFETCKPIKGYENQYLISDHGRVHNIKRGTVKSVNIDRQGYYYLRLSKHGYATTKRPHILVLEAFKGPRKPGMVSHHIDGNKLNNRVDNLEWVYAYEKPNRARFPGEANPQAKLKTHQVKAIKDADEAHKTLAKQYNVSTATIYRIKTGQNWGWVTNGN